MIPVPAVWNFNLSACLRQDIWNASLECFIAQAICFTNLKYCDDGLNGDYNLYMGAPGWVLLFQRSVCCTKNSDISGFSWAPCPWGSWMLHLPTHRYALQMVNFGEFAASCCSWNAPQKQPCSVESTMLEKLGFSVRWVRNFQSIPHQPFSWL